MKENYLWQLLFGKVYSKLLIQVIPENILANRQKEIRLCQGCTPAPIARRLFQTPRSIENKIQPF